MESMTWTTVLGCLGGATVTLLVVAKVVLTRGKGPKNYHPVLRRDAAKAGSGAEKDCTREAFREKKVVRSVDRACLARGMRAVRCCATFIAGSYALAEPLYAPYCYPCNSHMYTRPHRERTSPHARKQFTRSA